MGTFYTMGVIKNFTAIASNELALTEWENVLNDRIDLDCFDVKYSREKLEGELQESIFHDNIDGFYHVLRKILGKNRNESIDDYAETFGKNIKNYQIEYAEIKFSTENNIDIIVQVNFAMLFLEGKVMAEEFYTEPVLLNWLFRNSNINNKLAGCIVSRVVG